MKPSASALALAVALAAAVAVAALGAGCAAARPGPSTPRDLVGTWLVVEVDGRAVGGREAPTLSFDAPGLVSGQTGCNRFTSSYVRAGATLAFMPIGTTRMACPAALREQEARLLASLEAVTAFAFAEDGALVLQGLGGRSVTARAEPPAPARP